MFKNIQNKIIFTHPLIWNIKLIPMLIILGIFHLIIFGIGYFYGILDLKYSFLIYKDQEISFMLLAGLFAFLLFILWVFYYMRNNAFENFYPKKAIDLYLEWIYSLIIIFLICLFPATFFFGKETKIRSYIDYNQMVKDKEIISKASLFLNGSYTESEYYYIDENGKLVDGLCADKSKQKYRDSIYFNKLKYPFYSYMNKNVENDNQDYPSIKRNVDVNYQNNYEVVSKKESLLSNEVKNLLQQNKKNKISQILEEYLKIQKKYQHKNNLTIQKWMNLVYNYPNFEEKVLIGKYYDSKTNDNNDENYAYPVAVDSLQTSENFNENDKNTYQKNFDNSVKYYFENGRKYYNFINYTDFYNTTELYKIFTDAHNYQDCNWSFILGILFFAIIISLIIFIYKMIQWKNWLLTIVSSIIITIFTSLVLLFINSLIDYGEKYWINQIIMYFTMLIISFIIIGLLLNGVYKNNTKKHIGILIGLSVLIITFVLALSYVFSVEISEHFSGYKYFMNSNYDTKNINLELNKLFPKTMLLKSFQDYIFETNIIFILIVMYPMSKIIKKWKSLPEA